MGSQPSGASKSGGDFDYSTPEAQAALEGVTKLILEIRDEVSRRRYLEDEGVRMQNQRIRLLLERAAGERRAARIIRLLRPVEWTIRPLRIALRGRGKGRGR